MQKLVWTAALLIIGAVLVVKTSLASYAGTLWSQFSTQAKNQIPTRFELDRVRHELGQLDGDVSVMIRPIAEYRADIVRLHDRTALDALRVSAAIEDAGVTADRLASPAGG